MLGMLLYGLINSAVFMLMAIGFSLTFGISGVANFAYGAFYVTGAYVTWQLINSLGLSFAISIIISAIITGLFGALLYRFVLFRIRGLLLSEIIATFGIGMGMLEFYRSIGLSGHSYKLPTFMDGSLEVLGVYVDYQRVIIVGVAATLVFFLWFFSHHTKMGLAFRGIAQNERTAISLGIRSDYTAALSLAFGSAMAAVAAIVILPLGIISINTGYEVLLIAVAVGIVGGLESVPGILVASLILGYAQIITGTYFKPEWMMVVYLAAIVLVLAIKPSGLFGKFKELEERV